MKTLIENALPKLESVINHMLNTNFDLGLKVTESLNRRNETVYTIESAELKSLTGPIGEMTYESYTFATWGGQKVMDENKNEVVDEATAVENEATETAESAAEEKTEKAEKTSFGEKKKLKKAEEQIGQLEASLAEEQRQYNETMAYNKAQAAAKSLPHHARHRRRDEKRLHAHVGKARKGAGGIVRV